MKKEGAPGAEGDAEREVRQPPSPSAPLLLLERCVGAASLAHALVCPRLR